jgi:hypothetical protein
MRATYKIMSPISAAPRSVTVGVPHSTSRETTPKAARPGQVLVMPTLPFEEWCSTHPGASHA